MLLGSRNDIKCIAVVQQVLIGCSLLGRTFQVVRKISIVQGKYLARLKSIHILALTLYLIENRRFAHQSQAYDLLFTTDLGAGDTTCTIQINNLTISIEIIKLAFPVRPYRKDIHIQAFDIINLLSLIFLDDDFVGQSCGTHCFNTLHKRLLDIDFTSLTIEDIRSDTHYQIITQSFGSLQEADVTIM